MVLENDGGSLAAAITCAGLALADAHVPMYDLVTAASLVSYKIYGNRLFVPFLIFRNLKVWLFQGVVGDKLIMDPVEEEERCCQNLNNQDKNHGLITVALMGAHTQVTQMWQTGSMTTACVSDALTHLVQTCEETYPIAQRCLVKSVVDTISKKGQ